MNLKNRQAKHLCLFVVLVLIVSLFVTSDVRSRSTLIKQTWFEAGLLYRYSVSQFMKVLNFNFDSVLINPLKLDVHGNQTELVSNFADLLEAVDLYALEHTNFTKFLIVGGGSTFLHHDLIEDYVGHGYVMVMDDSGTNLEATRANLQYLKSLGEKTGLVHALWDGAKQLISEGLVDYSMPCFYPYFVNINNIDNLTSDFQIMKAWCEGKAEFLPAIQVFGLYNPKTNVSWRFPSRDELQTMFNFLVNMDPYGITWFLPHTGQSQRGETFEGFLDHSEVWDIIKDPQKKDSPFYIPKEVLMAVLIAPLAIIASMKIYYYVKARRQKSFKMFRVAFDTVSKFLPV